MKFKLFLLTFVCSIAVLFARATNTNPEPGSAEFKKNDIAGGVWHAETKKPISNVSITAYSINKKEKIVLTDGNGNYAINDLKPGTYKFVFEKNGYKKVTRDKVIIRQDEGCLLNVEMNEESEFQIIPGQLIFSDF
jgi:hypothetical protein